jgi:hypothetical protein
MQLYLIYGHVLYGAPAFIQQWSRKRETEIKRELKGEGFKAVMAGLAMFDQKNVIAVTIIIVTAFKICISHRKNGLLNRPCT